jgi:hypothetical protein
MDPKLEMVLLRDALGPCLESFILAASTDPEICQKIIFFAERMIQVGEFRDISEKIRIFSLLTQNYWGIDDKPKSLWYATEAEKLLKISESEFPVVAFTAYHLIAGVLALCGDFETSEACFRSSLRIQEKLCAGKISEFPNPDVFQQLIVLLLRTFVNNRQDLCAQHKRVASKNCSEHVA